MYYINNLYNFNIIELLIFYILMLIIGYIIEFIEFKKFAKEYYYININFFPFTYNLISKKIRAIF